MVHDAAVADGVGWGVRFPFSGDAVFYHQVTFRKWLVVVEVAVLFVKLAVLVISAFDDDVFYAEGVAEIFSGSVMIDFYGPVVDVFAIDRKRIRMHSRNSC